MKNLLYFFVALILFTACSSKNTEPDISESEHLVMATAWFQKSAEMRACYYQAYNLAEFRLSQHLENFTGEKPTAVVLDIDETILDNSPFEKRLIDDGVLYTSELWKTWTDEKSAIALPGALEFTKKAKEMGVEVIYISNRKENMLEATIENMKALGFPNADPGFIHLRKMDRSGDKTKRRSKVMSNYSILLYIGDNLTDFNEIFAHRDSKLGFKLVDDHRNSFGDKFIILPNPMYGEWEGALYNNDYSLSAQEKRALRKEILIGF